MSIEKMNFKRWVHKVLPAVYDESLSYYELLCKITAKLNEVIEQGNTTSEGLQELKEYVANYFENLDVQEEINNKLDEMAESGELTDIIAQYLKLAGVLAYDTKAQMKQAQNLTEGSITKTLGNLSYQDGQGAFYKVRQVQNTDIIDDDNIIALHDPDLVAEKIPYNGYSLQLQINNIIDQMNSGRTILIGDSYSLYRPNVQGIEGWAVPLRRKLGLSNTDCPILSSDGGGFVRVGSLGTFEQAITNATITDHNTIKNIIVCGGLNDCGQSQATILSAIESFISYCNTNYPNATIYIGHIGNENDQGTHDGQSLRWGCLVNSIPAYKQCDKFGARYLNGVEYIMKDYSNFYDWSHPNQTLCLKLADGIYQAFKTGYVSVDYPTAHIQLSYDSITGDKFNETQLPFDEIFVDNNDVLVNYPEFANDLTFKTNATINGNQIILAVMEANYFRNVFPNFEFAKCQVIFTKTDNTTYETNGSLELYRYNNQNYLVLNIAKPSSAITVSKLRFRQITSLIPGRLC